MRAIILACPFLILVSCSSKKEVFTKAQKKEFRLRADVMLEDISPGASFDSFTCTRLDSVTKKTKYNVLYSRAQRRYEYFMQLVELDTAAIAPIREQLKLAASLHYSSLFDIYKSNFDQKVAEMKKDLDSAKSMTDRSAFFDSLSRSADSATVIGYQALCPCQYKKKDRTVKRDTLWISMSKEKTIVSDDDLVSDELGNHQN